MKYFLRLIKVLGLSLFLYSCGLEDIPYLAYISEASMTDNTLSRIRLPSNTDDGYAGYFTHFVIFYRIYISNVPLSGTINTSDLRRQVNSYLESDYSGLFYLTDKSSTSVNPSNLETTFYNRKYYMLTLEGADINDVLDSGSLGGILEISFPNPTGVKPVLILNGNSYILRRAVSGPSINFTPAPDRYFLNSSVLYDNDNVINEKNADVATNTQSTSIYTYTSMYIAAVGKDYLSTIYSQPTHIGIFRLAEAF
jgi:hypothetical protein